MSVDNEREALSDTMADEEIVLSINVEIYGVEELQDQQEHKKLFRKQLTCCRDSLNQMKILDLKFLLPLLN